MATIEDRLLSKIDKNGGWPDYSDPFIRVKESDGQCWRWTGSTSNGYGYVFNLGRLHPAHRVSYLVFSGHFDQDLQIDHLCRVRCCVNPSHLEAVTQKENIRRSPASIANSSKTHCLKGHPYSGENLVTPKSGQRSCRICKNEYSKAYRKRLAEKR